MGWLSAGGAGAGPGGDEALEEVQGLVEGQVLDRTFGWVRCSVRNRWAAPTRVTWRCHPVNERPSKWSSPRRPERVGATGQQEGSHIDVEGLTALDVTVDFGVVSGPPRGRVPALSQARTKNAPTWGYGLTQSERNGHDRRAETSAGQSWDSPSARRERLSEAGRRRHERRGAACAATPGRAGRGPHGQAGGPPGGVRARPRPGMSWRQAGSAAGRQAGRQGTATKSNGSTPAQQADAGSPAGRLAVASGRARAAA